MSARRSISPRSVTALFALLALLTGLFYWLSQPKAEDTTKPDPYAVSELKHVWDVQTDPLTAGASFYRHNGPGPCIDEAIKQYGDKLAALNSDQITELMYAGYPFTEQDVEAKAAKACGDRHAINAYKIEKLRGEIIADQNEVELYQANNPTQLPWQLEARLEANKAEVTRLKEQNVQLEAAV